MANEQEADIVISFPLDMLDPAHRIEGSLLYLCSRCGVTVSLTPVSQDHVKQGARVLCVSCSVRFIEPGQLPSTSPEQWQELEEKMGRALTDAERLDIRRLVAAGLARYRHRGKDM